LNLAQGGFVVDTGYPADFEEIVGFHGHACAGLAIGYRAAKAARARLGSTRSGDEELVAVVETDACGVDALQVLLGCTLGKGNMIYRDYGKQVFTVICRERGQAVRIALRADALERPAEQQELVAKIRSGEASEEEHRAWDRHQRERILRVLEIEEATLFKIEEVAPQIPDRARIFDSVVCRYCGEKVMEPRARIRDGRIACIPCAETYNRGW
jgi:formylmethanofuran dehydrogenase subunit E